MNPAGSDAPATKTLESAGKSTGDPSAGKPAKKIKETPENLTAYEKEVGGSYVFTVTGAIFGTLYGSGPYTKTATL